ncbi:hypothetical protein CLU79DRAFT_777643 [Phycomyces nitens]|nr:hypothetical protein CLU79DRAFT_777643 [Phycomyces nitens]
MCITPIVHLVKVRLINARPCHHRSLKSSLISQETRNVDAMCASCTNKLFLYDRLGRLMN